MNGDRFLFDTNAIIALLRGKRDLLTLIGGADWIGISIISQIEFLAFSNLREEDKKTFEQFLIRVEIIGLDKSESNLIKTIIELRQKYRLKLPDAVIAATALEKNAGLISADAQFGQISELALFPFKD